MTKQTKEVLKGYFDDGDEPNGQAFADLIDSTVPEGEVGTVSDGGSTVDGHLAVWDGNNSHKIIDGGAIPTPEDVGFDNPMTTAGDLIVGGVDGVAARLAKGTALQVLRMNVDASAEEWATNPFPEDHTAVLNRSGDLLMEGEFLDGNVALLSLGATAVGSNGSDASAVLDQNDGTNWQGSQGSGSDIYQFITVDLHSNQRAISSWRLYSAGGNDQHAYNIDLDYSDTGLDGSWVNSGVAGMTNGNHNNPGAISGAFDPPLMHRYWRFTGHLGMFWGMNIGSIELNVIGVKSIVALQAGTPGQILKVGSNSMPQYASPDFVNPMTTAADLIVGGVSGAATRLPKGTGLQVLRMNAGATAQEWANSIDNTAVLDRSGDILMENEFFNGNAAVTSRGATAAGQDASDASAVMDGNDSTFWTRNPETGDNNPQSVTIDLHSTIVDVISWLFKQNGGEGHQAQYLDIAYSDTNLDGSWVAATSNIPIDSGNVYTGTFPQPLMHRYWKFTGHGGSINWGWRVQTIELHPSGVGNAVALEAGTPGQILKINSRSMPEWAAPTDVGFVNPMTAAGDLIVGDTAGVAAKLPIGTEGQVLKSVSGIPSWTDAPVTGMMNPMTTPGDIIVGSLDGGASDRLGIGTEGQVLGVSSEGLPEWVNPASGGMMNPMTTPGDIIIGSLDGGASDRLAIGAEGSVLANPGSTGLPEWAMPYDIGILVPAPDLPSGSGNVLTYDSAGKVLDTMVPVVDLVKLTNHTEPPTENAIVLFDADGNVKDSGETIDSIRGMTNPMTASGDLITNGVAGALKTSPAPIITPLRLVYAQWGGGNTGSAMLPVTGDSPSFAVGSPITVNFTMQLSRYNSQNCPFRYHWELRRDNASGAVLTSGVITISGGNSEDGNQFTQSGSYEDTTPTTGLYVVTVYQEYTGGNPDNGALFELWASSCSITTSFSVTAVGRLPIGEAGQVLQVVDGVPTWANSESSGIWQDYVPVWTSPGGTIVPGNSILTGRFVRIGNTVTVHISLRWGWGEGLTSVSGNGQWQFSLPYPSRDYDIGIAELWDNSVSPYSSIVASKVGPSGNDVAIPVITGDDTPFVWGEGDNMQLKITYELSEDS